MRRIQHILYKETWQEVTLVLVLAPLLDKIRLSNTWQQIVICYLPQTNTHKPEKSKVLIYNHAIAKFLYKLEVVIKLFEININN